MLIMSSSERKIKAGTGLCLSLSLLCCLFLAACSTPRVRIQDKEVALSRANEPILLVTPLHQDASMDDPCRELGNYYVMAISSRLEGTITYSGNIESLARAVSWHNLISNGAVNITEVATIARNLGCNSAVTIRVISYKQYPPFRMVVEMLWIDCLSNSLIGRLYDDIDMTNTDINYKFENYVGDGPGRAAYETFTYAPYKGLSKTASLQPVVFLNFVADYSSEAMFGGETLGMSSWRLWRIF